MKNYYFACGLVLLLGCGDDSATVGGSGGGSAGGPSGGSPSGGSPSGGSPSGGSPSGGNGGETVGGSGGAGGADVGGDCETNADCPPDGSCIELSPGSYRVCQYPIVEATSCPSKLDICCSSLDCEGVGASCLLTPITAFCAGIKQQPHNECASDQCVSDDDCGQDQICAPAGTLGNQIRVCLTATCEGQCAGGVPCAVIRNPCCGAALGLFCAPGCLTDADCPDGYCDVDPGTQESICVDGAPICPA